MTKLQDRVAIVTGATTGIGAEIARKFATEGAQVVLVGRRVALGEAVAQEIRDAGGRAEFKVCDVSNEDAVAALVKEVGESYGQLDIVVNNAATAPASPLEDMAIEDWNSVVANNVTSIFLVCKHSIPLLRKSSHGAIINMGSTFGVIGAGGSVAYAMTKAAAISMSKSLALELAASGIRVNALCPGGTNTPFLHDWAEDTGDKLGTLGWLVDRHPMGRFAETHEIAAGALYLASDDSSFVTGHSLMVDGGYTAQ
ncbi:MAG: SDR family NAD(P)-dependent oxidoreductase [Actinomycetes bacterium]|jgi:dihydroanticapsin dehydrogenase